jgi:UDP:flavonoid glycosyltransferase YjiC (YdhE family)
MVLREAMANLTRPLYEIVANHYIPGKTIVAAHPLDMGSRVAHERLGLPLASVELAPLAIRSVTAPPKIPFAPRRGPRWALRAHYWLVDRLFIDPLIAPSINGLRAELGLHGTIRRFYHRWWYSPQMVLCLWPDWFGPMQPDWPPHCHTVGFPLWDESDQAQLSAEAEDFLQDGEPPLVFTPGSANSFAEPFFVAAVAACRLLRRRGVLLTKYAQQVPQDLPSQVRHFEFLPLSRVLSRAAAFIHHGGIGSASQGLAAGVPQLVMPMAFDQPDNAERLTKLGVADVLPPRRFTGRAVATALERLLGNPEVVENARALANDCNRENALARAADLLETLLPRPVASTTA